MGDWKLVETNRGKTSELFNLREDPFERRDLSREEPGRASLLAEKLEQIMSSDPAP